MYVHYINSEIIYMYVHVPGYCSVPGYVLYDLLMSEILSFCSGYYCICGYMMYIRYIFILPVVALRGTGITCTVVLF